MNLIRKALYCAFFVFPTSVFCADCELVGPAQSATLAHVIDGDSLQLKDARQIRLLGINAPEMHVKATQKPAPLAVQAQQTLLQLLPKNSAMTFHHDQEKHDRYHRLLAQVSNAKGLDVAAELLKQGYAEVLVVPPNTRLADCYLAIERAARKNKKGMWADSALWQNTAQLRESENSETVEFVHIYGRVAVETMTRTPKFTLDQRLRLHIDAAELINMVKARQNNTIYIRGYLRWKNRKPHLSLKHASQILP